MVIFLIVNFSDDDDDLGFKGAQTTMVIGAHNMTLKDYVVNITKKRCGEGVCLCLMQVEGEEAR